MHVKGAGMGMVGWTGRGTLWKQARAARPPELGQRSSPKAAQPTAKARTRAKVRLSARARGKGVGREAGRLPGPTPLHVHGLWDRARNGRMLSWRGGGATETEIV